jgi:hypothetical protein
MINTSVENLFIENDSPILKKKRLAATVNEI